MSKTTLIGTLLFLAACTGSAGGPGAWQKAGATDATVAADTAQCRTTAQQTAARLYPLGSSNPTLGGAGMIASQQQANTDRTSAETPVLQRLHGRPRLYARPEVLGLAVVDAPIGA